MQPALADVVQKLTVPLSTATASWRLAASRSFPSWTPVPRAWPKPSEQLAGPRRIDPQSKRLDRSGDLALNPFDVHAIEEGLRQRDAAGGGEVVVVSMGPERAAEALRRALALGADRAVLVSDDALAGSDLL